MASLHYGTKEMNPFLSIVVTSRNDNHGGDLLFRMQHFVDGLIAQCNAHKLSAELIIVEWNPPQENPFLSEALKFSEKNRYCSVRIIRVPKKIHDTIAHSDKIPLFQMLGKNVGIKRAKGKFILATNIDILFSDEIIKFMKRGLKSGRFYRVDRVDVARTLPESANFKDILKFCKRNVLLVNTRVGIKIPKGKNPKNEIPQNQKSILERVARSYSINPIVFLKRLMNRLHDKIYHTWIIDPNFTNIRKPLFKLFMIPLSKKFMPLNTNGCGDFTLMSSKDWSDLRGYPEWHVFSWHLDGVLLFQADQHGLKEIDLAKEVYHIEHDGGYTPKGEAQLFERLNSKGIPYLTSSDLDEIYKKLKNSESKVVFNTECWGLSNHNLEEVRPS